MKVLLSGVTMLGAFVLGCTRSQAPSPSVDPSAGRSAAEAHAASSAAPAPAAPAPAAPAPAAPASAAPASGASAPGAPARAARATTAATRDACAACNGEWGRHGVAETDSCNCRTKDKGKVCRDGRDCSGECIVDLPLFEVVEQGPPVRGRFRGRCSEFVTVFGCNALLSDGARDAPIVKKDQAPEELCVD